MKKLNVTWFNEWKPVLDEALQELPEKKNCPHELYRLLAQNTSSARKRIALVTERGAPVALAVLRQKSRYSWEPATQWLIPGLVFPAKPEYQMRAIEALGVDIWVAWWRMEGEPPPSSWTRSQEATPVNRIRCTSDVEQYWRDTKHIKNIKQARNRCQGFTLAVNQAGAAELVIKNWDAKWRSGMQVDPSIADRILIAKYLERIEQHYTLLLLDGDTPIAGATNIVHDNDLVAGVIYREPSYDKFGVGVRIIELVFSLAAEKGFEWMDIGGGHDYKNKWAPESGQRQMVNICPEYIYQTRRAISWARTVPRQINTWVRAARASKESVTQG